MIAVGGGGGWQSFFFMFRKIENDGMRPNPLSRTEKGGYGGWEKVRELGNDCEGLSQNPPPNTPETHRTWLRYMATQTHILEPK